MGWGEIKPSYFFLFLGRHTHLIKEFLKSYFCNRRHDNQYKRKFEEQRLRLCLVIKQEGKEYLEKVELYRDL